MLKGNDSLIEKIRALGNAEDGLFSPVLLGDVLNIIREHTPQGDILEALQLASAYIAYVKDFSPALHKDADGLPSVEQSVHAAIAAMGSVSCQELKVSGVTPRNDPANLYNPAPETLQSDGLNFTMGDASTRKDEVKSADVASPAITNICASPVNDKNRCLSESGESDRQSEISDVNKLECEIGRIIMAKGGNQNTAIKCAKGIAEFISPLLRTTEPVSSDHRKIGCLIHDALDTSKQKHENVIAIYDAIKPYLVEDSNAH